MSEEKKDCDSCANKGMEPMDMNPYCAAVNPPWGKYLHNGHPEACGPDRKLWEKDTRRIGRL